MTPLFSSSFRSGLMALGLVVGLSAPSFAGPISQPAPSVPANTSLPDLTQVRDGWAGGNSRHIRRNWNNNSHWRGGGRHWGGGGRHWDRGNNWRHGRRHGGFYGGSGFVLGLGLGGLGAYDYYNDGYYAPPRYRVVRRASGSHAQWCYNRYRSYRAWDNTFQPYNGPRQQCYSPYR